MRPDQRWFPTNRVERASWFRTFTTNFEKIGLSLGFSQADIDSAIADNLVVQYLSISISRLESDLAAVRAYQRSMTGGRSNGQMHVLPEVGLPSPPPAVPQGIYERLEKRVRRIRVMQGYTESVGALLGIIPKAPTPIDLTDVSPRCKVWTSVESYSFSVRCTVGRFDGFEISYRRQGSNEWTNAGRFRVSPAIVELVPTEPGKPEQIFVRVRMLKGNDPVGQYSETYDVVIK